MNGDEKTKGSVEPFEPNETPNPPQVMDPSKEPTPEDLKGSDKKKTGHPSGSQEEE